MNTIDDFYNVCFDPKDQVWVTTKALLTSRCYAIDWSKAKKYSELDVPGGIYLAVNAGIGRRMAENVAKARTFLIEFDSLPIKDQLSVWKSTKLPVSAIISSGGKSLHFWLTLCNPLPVGEYKEYFLRLWLLLSKLNDRQCADPCRYSRMPGAKRDGKEQTLLYVGSRIPNEILKKVLFTEAITKQYEEMFSKTHTENVYKVLNTVPVDRAVEYLNEKYPLTTGIKQANLLVWARYLYGSAGVSTNEGICKIIAENDKGNNRTWSEYERVAAKVLSSVTSSTIPDNVWTDK